MGWCKVEASSVMGSSMCLKLGTAQQRLRKFPMRVYWMHGEFHHLWPRTKQAFYSVNMADHWNCPTTSHWKSPTPNHKNVPRFRCQHQVRRRKAALLLCKLFICSSFNDADSKSDYRASNDCMMMNNDLERLWTESVQPNNCLERLRTP
jgi:hypothetical protein